MWSFPLTRSNNKRFHSYNLLFVALFALKLGVPELSLIWNCKLWITTSRQRHGNSARRLLPSFFPPPHQNIARSVANRFKVNMNVEFSFNKIRRWMIPQLHFAFRSSFCSKVGSSRIKSVMKLQAASFELQSQFKGRAIAPDAFYHLFSRRRTKI